MQIVGASLPVRLSSGPRACRGGSRFRSENRLQAGSYTDHLTAFLSTSEGGVHCIDTAKSSPENRRTRPSRWGQPGVWGRTARTGTTRWSSRLLEPARARPKAEPSFRSPVSAFRYHFPALLSVRAGSRRRIRRIHRRRRTRRIPGPRRIHRVDQWQLEIALGKRLVERDLVEGHDQFSLRRLAFVVEALRRLDDPLRKAQPVDHDFCLRPDGLAVGRLGQQEFAGFGIEIVGVHNARVMRKGQFDRRMSVGGGGAQDFHGASALLDALEEMQILPRVRPQPLDLIRAQHTELPAITIAHFLRSLPGGVSVERRRLDRFGSRDDDPLLIRLLQNDIDADLLRFETSRRHLVGLYDSTEMNGVDRAERRIAAEVGAGLGNDQVGGRGGRGPGHTQRKAAEEQDSQQSRRELHGGRKGRPSLADEPGLATGYPYSHSMVAGGLELMSSTTRLTPRTSFVMRLEMRCNRSGGNRAQSAVIASMLS